MLLVENAVGHDMAKPYLEALPQSYAAELLVFEWLTFLLEEGGTAGMDEAFCFYRSTGSPERPKRGCANTFTVSTGTAAVGASGWTNTSRASSTSRGSHR